MGNKCLKFLLLAFLQILQIKTITSNSKSMNFNANLHNLHNKLIKFVNENINITLWKTTNIYLIFQIFKNV